MEHAGEAFAALGEFAVAHASGHGNAQRDDKPRGSGVERRMRRTRTPDKIVKPCHSRPCNRFVDTALLIARRKPGADDAADPRGREIEHLEASTLRHAFGEELPEDIAGALIGPDQRGHFKDKTFRARIAVEPGALVIDPVGEPVGEEEVQQQIVDMALEHSELSPRELAVRFTDEKRCFVSEATVYRLLKAHDLITSPAYTVIKAADQFHTQTTRPNEMWQTDFTYFKIIGWGWMYLSTVLDDYSRYIIAGKLCTTMKAEEVTETLDMALTASGCEHANVKHRPRLLSDNGPSYIAEELADYLGKNGMDHVRGAPFHPQTQGKIERWHQTLKNRVMLENYFLPGDLERQIKAFVEHYNHQPYHESLGNVTPADAYFGRATAIIQQRERIKQQTLEKRRLLHHKIAA